MLVGTIASFLFKLLPILRKILNVERDFERPFLRGWLFLCFLPERYSPPLLLTSVMIITGELISNNQGNSRPSTGAMGLTDLMMEYLGTVHFLVGWLISKCQSGGFFHLCEIEGEVVC